MKNPVSRRSREEWCAIIRSQQQSKEPVPVYCRQHNLNVKSFYLWRKRLGMNSEGKAKDFIRVEPAGGVSFGVIRIRTPKGYCLEIPEGMDGRYVKTILAVTG